jgi:L-amino acid N-acyltransferase YncA
MVRLARTDDAAAIAGIYNENLAEGGFANSDLDPDSTERRSHYLAHAEERHPTYVYHIDGRIDGWACLKQFSARPVFSTIGEIAIYITKRYRNRLIAAALLDRMVADAPALGYKHLLAIVLHPNSASMRGLQAVGFRPVACLKKSVYIHNQWVDIHWLELNLSADFGAAFVRSQLAKRSS